MDVLDSASQEMLSFRGKFDSLKRVSYINRPMPATILIADDYEDNLELLGLLLTAAGYQIKEARNGQECLTQALAQIPDLIMIDLSMPVLDGWEVFRQLKANSFTARIPCVAVTAFGDSDRYRALEAGFDGYLSKPFRGAELLETVAQLLELRPNLSSYST
jgi:CheY-like chemotaxis protein